MSDLPSEITEQIFFRLPARTLLNCNLVCKKWRSIISNPKFVKDHANLVLSDQSNNHCKLITDYFIQKLSIISRSIDYESLNCRNYEFRYETRISPPAILGCCNGLLLLGIYDYGCRKFNALVVCNPLLSKTNKFSPPCNTASLVYSTGFYGLGYAPLLDDYKVVIVDGNYNASYSELEANVYSLKTNSWKAIPVPVTILCDSLSFNAGTYVRGVIYWIAYDTQIESVITFDLITEKFKLIGSPRGDDYTERFELVHVRGYLGACKTSIDLDEIVIRIWNEDENTQGYWTTLLKIPLKYPRFTRVLSVMNSTEVLLCVSKVYGSQKLVIYDGVCMMFQDIPCGKVRRKMHHMVETLVSPISNGRGL